MALQPTTTQHHAASYRALGLALLVAAAVVALMLALTAVAGVQPYEQSFQFVADPAAALGLPF